MQKFSEMELALAGDHHFCGYFTDYCVILDEKDFMLL